MIRVLIADDQPVVRAGVRFIVSSTADVRVEGEAGSAAEVLELTSRGHWDVLVVELAVLIPSEGLIDLVKELKRLTSKFPVLALSALPEAEFGLHALRAGASGFLSKQSSPEDLLRAIRKVAAGSRYIAPVLAETIYRCLDEPGRVPCHSTLSTREFQIFLQLAAGATSSELARKTGLSARTISTYRARIFNKLHLRSNFELIHYAMQHGLDPSIHLTGDAAPNPEAASAAAAR